MMIVVIGSGEDSGKAMGDNRNNERLIRIILIMLIVIRFLMARVIVIV